MRDIIQLLEEKSKPQDIEIIALNFEPSEVSPVISKDTLDLHYGKLAHDCGLEEIQIVEYDTQKLKVKSTPSKFVNVWSSMGFTEEALDLALLSLNNHDLKKYKQEFKLIKPTEGNKDTHIRFIPERGMNLIRKSIALDDNGEPFHYKGMLIPHAETITMSEFFSYKGDAPSIMYIYRPCDEAIKALEYIRQNNYKPLKDWQVVRNKDIISGWDSVCCLLKFKNGRQWIGGTILGKKDINKMKFKSGATTIQVAAFMNASIKWMLANPNEGLLQAENVPNAFIFENANKYLGLSIVREI
jgi:homospermidine synthase